jgi:Na+/melibiose symporter-like transporter
MEEKHPGVMALELHEEFIQHIERGGKRLRFISLITLLVSLFFIVNYVFQLFFLPYVLGQRVQEVNLTDPALVVFGLILIFFSAIWAYISLSNIIFVSRLSAQINEIRRLQKEIEKKIS